MGRPSGLLCLLAAAASSPVPLYKQAAAPIPDRVADLLSRMTQEEKVQQTWHPYGGADVGTLCAKGLGGMSIDEVGGADPAARVAARNALQVGPASVFSVSL